MDAPYTTTNRKGNDFCSMRCKNQYNVYKTRGKKKAKETSDE